MFGILWYVVWYVLVFELLFVYLIIIEYEWFYIELSVVNMDEVREEKYLKKYFCFKKIYIYLKDFVGYGDGVMYVSYWEIVFSF